MPTDHWFPTSIYWNDVALERGPLLDAVAALEVARPEPWLHKCDTSFFVNRMLHHDPRFAEFAALMTLEAQAYCRDIGA
ncbi:MAG: hypothetical protein RLW62_09175, partial [Gammaproteobacteria bacterium]